MGRPQCRGRRPPIFNNDLWNMFDRSQDELPRTNNSVEGWHRSFQSNVGRNQASKRCKQALPLTQAMAGHAPQPGRRTYSDLKT